jgi:hypothetical protein
MAQAEKKPADQPDETRSFGHGRLDLYRLAGGTVGRFTLEPGWRWSSHVKPAAGTEWCEVSHMGYQLSGTLHVRMQDGTEFDVYPGDIGAIPPGHDAWVAGDEPVVMVDWAGAAGYGVR